MYFLYFFFRGKTTLIALQERNHVLIMFYVVIQKNTLGIISFYDYIFLFRLDTEILSSHSGGGKHEGCLLLHPRTRYHYPNIIYMV